MSVSLSVHTLSDHLDMYGEPDPTSAYSLSGHVAISLSSTSSFFERRRTTRRFLLQSLSLTFEGQAEVYTPSIAYSAVRVCSVTRELVPFGEAIELSNEGQEDSGEPCVWNIIFNIPVPGWLPPSFVIGMDDMGVRYGLYATAKLLDLDEGRSGSWALAALCAPFRSRTKLVQARQRVQLRRFVAPPSPDPPVLAAVNYLVNKPTIAPRGDDNRRKRIPAEILSKIQVILTVPEIVNMDEDKMSVVLRMRADGLLEDERERIQLLDVSFGLRQIEKCRNRPSSNYRRRFPLPPPQQQPPNEPLIQLSELGTIHDDGILAPAPRCDAITRKFSLTPPHGIEHHKVPGNNRIFASGSSGVSPDLVDEQVIWYALEMAVPFAKEGTALTDVDCEATAPLRPSGSSPLFVVYHEITVSLTCAYELPGFGGVAQEKLSFAVPVSFGMVAPAPPLTPLLSPDSPRRFSFTPIASLPSLPTVEPYAPTLPAYSQLYDGNGERKIDYSVPLPLYTPPSPIESETGESSYYPTTLERVDVPLDGSHPRRKWENITQPTEGDEEDEGEGVPLLGASTR